MRLGLLPCFWLASLVIYGWARRDFGGPVAAIATGLFTLLPPVLAHAGLATTDMALAACLTLAFFALLLWAAAPTWQRSVLLGAAAGLAAISTFTAMKHKRLNPILSGTDIASLRKVLNAKPWYTRITPTERVGGLILYNIPPGYQPPEQ